MEERGAKILGWGGVKCICVYFEVMWILISSPAARNPGVQSQGWRLRVSSDKLCVLERFNLSEPSLPHLYNGHRNE